MQKVFTFKHKVGLVGACFKAVVSFVWYGNRYAVGGFNRWAMLTHAKVDWQQRNNSKHWGYSTQPQPVWAYISWTTRAWLDCYL